ncbi:GNAT family protein [Iodobacter sp. CM08]|uniref:GNAT family N-acetyltransferase n=1 Tax=Iodobacter sp. CM08 TaxID=3085902 RepID=UPI002980AF95|nr:GNAT family protein [Iodobacter sp. CM08]MDW5417524.1 GNAT family protein [Iodobacter sp. CM08]
MNYELNDFYQPIGLPLLDWKMPVSPPKTVFSGWGCRVEPLQFEKHGASLWQAFSQDDGRMWTYLTSGPFDDFQAFDTWLRRVAGQDDPQFYAILDAASGAALGLASYLRIDPAAGSIEVGWLHFSPALQGTRLATAAMLLMMENVFALGYRRYEWKCNALNAPSRRAAQRLGFSFEGVFRQAAVNRGRNRDTAWFSVIDSEWPALRDVLYCWLAEDNFDAGGQQRRALSSLTRPLLSRLDEGEL